MTGLEKIITDPATIKAAIDKTEGLLKGLFGKAFEETGEIIADQVRLRRFKNQIKIFEKAQKYLKDKNIDPQKVNLKVLAPLVEFASYEEDENLQDLWAKLIKNILSRPTSVVLQQNAIEVLNKVSNEEVKILDHIFDKLKIKRKERADKLQGKPRVWGGKTMKDPEDFRIDWFSFKVKEISAELKINEDELETQISNLVALGTLKYETEVDISSAEKSSEDPSDTSLDIDLDVSDYDRIRITKLGYVFVELCRQ
ncbi:MAG: Abi-alpha family protein [Lutibacter sp.]